MKNNKNQTFKSLFSTMNNKWQQNKKDLLGKADERKPKIEQVNLNGGRLLREAKVRFLLIRI